MPSCNETYYTTELSQGTLHAPNMLNKIQSENLKSNVKDANWVSLRADPERFLGFVKKANALHEAMDEFYDMMEYISSYQQYGVLRLVEISLKSLT